MVGVDFCLLLCYADPRARAGLFAFVKRSRGCGGGAPDALSLAQGHLWPRPPGLLGEVTGLVVVRAEGGMRVSKALLGAQSPKSCIWPKSDPVPPGV